jgi:hypothetical protein
MNFHIHSPPLEAAHAARFVRMLQPSTSWFLDMALSPNTQHQATCLSPTLAPSSIVFPIRTKPNHTICICTSNIFLGSSQPPAYHHPHPPQSV